MTATFVTLILLVLLMTGMPLVFAMGAASAAYLFLSDIDLGMLTQRMTTAVSSFVILAIPLFYLAGELMNACRLTDRIIAMARAFVGHIHGGLAQVNILASMIFAGMSGSATADTAALGSILIPAMKKEGYPAGFSAAVTVASAMIGPIIPPSIGMVIFGAVADVSIGRLLLAGIVPGVTVGVIQMIFTYFIARRRNFPRHPRSNVREAARAAYHGGPALLFPAIVVGGIVTGVFTPTEAAAVAVLYGLFLGLFVYRNVGPRKIWATVLQVTWGSVRVLIIIAVASAFSWIMVREQVPQAIAGMLATVTDKPVLILFIMVAFLLLVGLLMISSSAEIVLAPILVPVVVHFGIDPVHFGVLMVLTLIIGGGTPPVGVLLYIAQDIAKISFAQMVRAMLPFYLPLFAAIVILIFFPQLSLFIPNLVFGTTGG